VTRRVQAELLDELAPTDPGAIRARRDLQRLNSWMGNDAILARVLRTEWPGAAPSGIAELGGGDGTFLLNVLRRMSRFWTGSGERTSHSPPRRLVFVDRQDVVSEETRRSFALLGWRLEMVTADVFDWLRSAAAPTEDVIIANLLLHHFSEEQLAEIFERIAGRARLFVAIEPRRWRVGNLFSRCVGLIGCGPVTRHDAPASVRAGFCRQELARIWGNRPGWNVQEQPVGLFGHLFVARQ
jgi:hypothetical protein